MATHLVKSLTRGEKRSKAGAGWWKGRQKTGDPIVDLGEVQTLLMQDNEAHDDLKEGSLDAGTRISERGASCS
jgi:hypothetical protein